MLGLDGSQPFLVLFLQFFDIYLLFRNFLDPLGFTNYVDGKSHIFFVRLRFSVLQETLKNYKSVLDRPLFEHVFDCFSG